MIKSSVFELRLHHCLCLRFFEGKGYDGAFIRQMEQVISYLETHNPLIKLTDSCDSICEVCPNRQGARCRTHSKVTAFDQAFSAHSHLYRQTQLSWFTIKQQTDRLILRPHLLSAVCHDCQWYSICDRKLRELFP